MFLPFLKNPFASSRIAREDFRDLMQGNLSRMAGQNTGGAYTAMMAALQPHHDAYAAFLGEQDEALGGRYGDTDAVDKLLADFKAWTKKELLVDVPYVFTRTKPNPGALTEFLPKGRREYGRATLLTLPTLLKRVADLTAAHKADLGQPLADHAAKLQADYLAARQTQGASKGEVQDDSKQEKKLRKAAARQLKLNLLDQVKLHLDDADAVKSLYDPKLFTQPKKGDQSAGSMSAA